MKLKDQGAFSFEERQVPAHPEENKELGVQAITSAKPNAINSPAWTQAN